MTDPTPVVFISYAREDRNLCERLAGVLALTLGRRGYDVWWDQALVAGAWQAQIEAALDRSVAGILLVSEHSLASHHIRVHELPTMLEHGPVAFVLAARCAWEEDEQISSQQFLGSTDTPLNEAESQQELAWAIDKIAQGAADFLNLHPIVFEPRAHPAGGEASGIADTESRTPDFAERPGVLHAVPSLPATYFTRTRTLYRLRARLLAPPGMRSPFGLHGSGGIGKTVLAAALAHDEAVRRAFPDGIYWLTIGERPDPVAAQTTLANMLGLPADFRTEDEGRAALRPGLSGRRVLLVLDDVWSAADAEVLMVVEPPGRVMVTTRRQLVLDRLEADKAVVERLGFVEAKQFLSRVTRQPEPLPREADQVVDAVGGVVLALSLVGATIRHGTSWSNAVAELNRAGEVFSDESYANQFKAMQLAWAALAKGTQDRYQELSVFGDDVTVPLATVKRLWRQTAGMDQHHTEAVCAELEQRGLLTLDEGLHLHDLQRAFLHLQTPNFVRSHRQFLEAHSGVPAIAGRWSTLPDDEPYLWDHLVEHLLASGDVAALEELMADPVWLLRRYHLQGPHAPESDLVRGLSGIPEFRLGERILSRLRQASHLLGALTELGDRASTLACQIDDLVGTATLAGFFPEVRVRPAGKIVERSDALERVLAGHSAGVWSADWSPDGRLIASANLDGAIRILETDAAGRQAALLRGHRGSVRTVAWSPDGRRLASAGDDGTLRVWSAQSWGSPPLVVTADGNAIWSASWSPDGRSLAAAVSGSGVLVWEPESAKKPAMLETGHRGTIWSVAWSPDGSHIAAGGVDGSVRVVRAGIPGSERVTAGEHDGWAAAVAWSPDGKRIASGGDRTVRIWDLEVPGQAEMVLDGHDDLVWALDWSPAGDRVASGSSDRTVRVWDLSRSSECVVLEGADDHVWTVAWSPEGSRLVSGSHDGTLRVWNPDVPTSAPGRTVLRSRWIWAVDWSPDGRQLATGAEDGRVLVWDFESPERPPAPVATLEGGVWTVTWSPDGTMLAAGGADRIIYIWQATAWDSPLKLVDVRGLVRSIAWSPDGRQIAAVSDDAALRVWEIESSGEGATATFTVDDEVRARAVCWSPNGLRLATGHDDGSLRVRAADSPGRTVDSVSGHSGRVEAVAWSPDGRLLASTGVDGVVRIWDADKMIPRSLEGHNAPATAVAWSPDGRHLLSGSEDSTVRLWDASSGKPLSALGLGGMICSLAWGGDRIAVGLVTTWVNLVVEGGRTAEVSRA